MKKKSLPSLLAGCSFGALYMTAGYLINSDDVRNGFAVGTGTGTVLVAAMLPRFVKTGAFMPAGRKWTAQTLKTGAFMPAGRKWTAQTPMRVLTPISALGV